METLASEGVVFTGNLAWGLMGGDWARGQGIPKGTGTGKRTGGGSGGGGWGGGEKKRGAHIVG